MLTIKTKAQYQSAWGAWQQLLLEDTDPKHYNYHKHVAYLDELSRALAQYEGPGTLNPIRNTYIPVEFVANIYEFLKEYYK